MKPLPISAVFILGFLIGGFPHIWFINDVGYGALIEAGQSGFGWNVTTVGEDIGASTIFYLLNIFLYALVGFLHTSTMIANGWWNRGTFPFRRPRIDALWALLIALILGALGAVSFNQWSITADYHHAATEEAFAASTIAIALPAMQAFTATYQRAFLALLLLLLLAWGGDHWRRQRRGPLAFLTPFRANGE